MTSWNKLLQFIEDNWDYLNIRAIEKDIGAPVSTIHNFIKNKTQESKYKEPLRRWFIERFFKLSEVYAT